VEEYDAGAFWNDVGRQLLQRPSSDQSTIASDDTTYYALKQRRFFAEFLDPALRDASSVLEIGPGPGGNLSRLRAQGKVVHGADVSSSMREIARRNGLDCIELMDGKCLPFEDRSVDAVFTSTVLQHNDDEHAASLLAEMARVAAREVHLFEDTAPVPVRDRRSHWLRRPAWYSSRLRPLGYELTLQRRLPLTCQEIAATAARVLMDRHLPQGADPTPKRLHTEEMMLRVARPIDRVIPPAVGLTRLSFRRIG
jgi:ubiquinone/menaquinone biosynthesis C-methylase UbiE